MTHKNRRNKEIVQDNRDFIRIEVVCDKGNFRTIKRTLKSLRSSTTSSYVEIINHKYNYIFYNKKKINPLINVNHVKIIVIINDIFQFNEAQHIQLLLDEVVPDSCNFFIFITFLKK